MADLYSTIVRSLLKASIREESESRRFDRNFGVNLRLFHKEGLHAS
jgi:hypothetical protein